ncbi:MAG TPA: glycosyl transferase, partial [Rhodospirillaceae bacterium]|nr:glycosyl transferase [Rhodospirillaceae bacterium]
GLPGESVPAVLRDYEQAPLSDAFAVQLVYRLRDQDPRITPALTWLDERLVRQGATADSLVRDEHQMLGATSVTVRNIITSMRHISDVDWADLVESVSLVDGLLSDGSDYQLMDFRTRNLYRSAIEDLARHSPQSETEIARWAVLAAKAASGRAADPGYHLIGGGRRAFESVVGYRPTLAGWAWRLNKAVGIGGYATAVAVSSGGLLSAPLLLLAALGIDAPWICLLGSVGAIPAIDLAVALVNRAAIWSFGARFLPALWLKDGIPSELRTLVAVPTLLTSAEAIEEQIERLEVHFLASPEGDLSFALLSDWGDADSATTPLDTPLFNLAEEGIARLNRRHGPAPGGSRFLLLHRRRVWSEGEQRWLGWERKRGKLHELNRLLRGATDTSYVDIDGRPPAVASGIRYVVTLDADTRLPRDTVRRLIGKMAHPLNRPLFDKQAGRVVEGYAVMQPRVTPSLPVGREGSLYQRTFSSMNGIDSYAAAVSDVYQDLFAEGSYAGKGIYDVDAFEAALADRVPDSSLLSHDLFEGIFAGAGLVSDIEVIEEFPSRYDVDALRHHRWARGDWQLLPWILGSGPKSCAGHACSPVSAIGRWKMIDNLRRSLSAPAAVLAIVGGFLLPLPGALAWTAFILASILVPTLIPVMGAILPQRSGVSSDSHLRALGNDVGLALTQSALRVVFLAHQAWLMTDAITRTLFRLTLTRRHLLEWVTAAQATVGPRLDLLGFCRRMGGGWFFAALAAVVAGFAPPGVWPLAAFYAALWFFSPVVARWASLPPLASGQQPASPADLRSLRLIARRTWRFFESFVTAENHRLPPDNFQEDPQPVVAHRTSPTNIGLYLLSVVAARDFGWIGTAEALERLEETFVSLQALTRYRGHFYNWYDTQDLRPLAPLYVSSVDSGNLAGHLLALANGCRQWRQPPEAKSPCLAGIKDGLELALEAHSHLNDGRKTQTVTWHQLDEAMTAFAAGLSRPIPEGEGLPRYLGRLAKEADALTDMASAMASERDDLLCSDLVFWCQAIQRCLNSHRRDETASLDERLLAMEQMARSMALGMEFGFLLDGERKLLSIGYLVAEGVLDNSCYDLLASEACLASFFAIAKGDIPARHWFRLGRTVTPVARGAALVSWSGSMFEYLMPSLVMRAPAGSLIEQTNRLIVARQIQYGAAQLLPWGISESAYNARDLEFTYQYLNFGVPGLGLKRGLGDDFVVAPYATALASMVDPQAATRNFEQLRSLGAYGRYGFYEALDYTPSRLPDGQTTAIIRSFMAHHQGMTIVAIANSLLDGIMRSRFHSEPIIQATELLLQERTPRDVAVARPSTIEAKLPVRLLAAETSGRRRLTTPHGLAPATQLLSNGQYTVLLTAAGSGYSRWGNVEITRWQEDSTCDGWGSYIFLRDIGDGTLWSAGYQPTATKPDFYEALFREGRAEITRRDGPLTTTLDVLVSGDMASEVRRVSLTNSGSRSHDIEVTSYAELVLAPLGNDGAHPAFAKLFVETDYLPEFGLLLATRRRRQPEEAEIWAAHLAVVDGQTLGKAEIETDRARFIGRGCTVRTPIAVLDGRPLSNTVGTVLDPVFVLRRVLRIPPGGTVRIAFWTMVASSREAVLALADKHRDATAFDRAATLAWTQAQVQLHHLGIDGSEAALFQRLAGHLLYVAPAMRPASDSIRQGAAVGQPGLWVHGISGDLPIIVLRISDGEHLSLVRQLLQAHEYWHMKRFAVDVVILNERASSYVQDLQIALETLVRSSQSPPQGSSDGPRGRVFILRADLISAESRALLSAVARVVLVAQRGRLSDQLDRVQLGQVPPSPLLKREVDGAFPPPQLPGPELEFFNGLGGFTRNGQEYVTILGPGQSTPAPWINVIANPSFGFQVAAEGSGYSWSLNSRENKLTPWSNDPVADPSGEVFYLQDEVSGALWSPTAQPIRNPKATYLARHGRGYSRFEHSAYGVTSALLQFVPLDDPIKISRLTLTNNSGRDRSLSVTAYVEWVLGVSRSATMPYVITEIDPVTGVMLARNRWNPAFASQVAFIHWNRPAVDWTGDRREFLGRNGHLAAPAALNRAAPLSNSTGAGFDPCGALRTRIDLPANGSVELVFFLGQAASAEAAGELIGRYAAADIEAVMGRVSAYWDGLLDAVQVKTPDRSMDIMLNGWLLYQTLACRIWARSAFYQSSGAYGFRDQLQDGMALASRCPAVTRQHLLSAAGRQFCQGDVQHWWLAHSGQGVRTRISDDRAWLAFAVAHYVETSADQAVLDVEIPFLDGETLLDGQHDSFFLPTVSDETATLFEHCARALDDSLRLGSHGLPLMGTGDWNDGMNRVGAGGRGESVWLGWLLYTALKAFADLAALRRMDERATKWRDHAERLQTALEQQAWDGEWYRRGWFDDGTVLGAADSQECQIDSIAQSWAVLSGAASPEHATQAMAAAERRLILWESSLALLFSPPFDQTALDPGYIKGYPPGIRENGGQYTHASLWLVMALAGLGEGDKASKLFSLLNPINHARSRAEIHRYKVEPYVVAADIYAKAPHIGRGGWSWYTGSAGWMQRAGIESILGLRLQGGILHFDPCIPRQWPGFEIALRLEGRHYEVQVDNPDSVERGVAFASIDDIPILERPLRVTLADDGKSHRLRVRLGAEG